MRWQSCALVLMCFCGVCGSAQELKQRPAVADEPAKILPATPAMAIPLTVPVGTPLKVALDAEVRVRQAGQSVHGKITEPVYAFDKLVIPAGSEVTGKISEIGDVSKKLRTLAAANGSFSPPRRVHIEFDELRLADGRLIPLHTVVTPAFARRAAIRGGERKEQRQDGHRHERGTPPVRSGATADPARMGDGQGPSARARQDAPVGALRGGAASGPSAVPGFGNQFQFRAAAVAEFRRRNRYASEALAQVGMPPPSGDSAVHAQLATPLSSATAKKGDPVEAVITQPRVRLRSPRPAGGKPSKGIGAAGACGAAAGTQRPNANRVS